MLAILLAAAGFFTVGTSGDRAMFFDPEGKEFYLRGCGTVDKVYDQAPALLRRCGFNAVAQPAPEMVGKGFAWTYNFNVGRRFMEKGKDYVRKNPQGHGFPNVNHPEFEQYVKSFVAKFVAGKRDDPTLLGYFIDNELAFDMASDEEIRRYFDITSKAIREADPNHMLLGCRFMGGKITSNAVAWEECGRVCDVVSVNIYPKLDLYRRRIYVHDVYFGADGKEIEVVDLLPKLSARCRRPVIVTEWSFPSLDTPHANLVGGGCRVDTQCERAEASALFVRQLYSVKCLPGYIYFRWFDCDSWSKERTNYGLVSDEGVPYMPLVEAFEEVQGRFEKYFGLPPPPRREWPRLPRSFKDLAAEAGLAGDAPSWPDRVSFPREQFDAYPIAGRRVIALAAKPGKRPRAYMHVEGTPLKDPQRWLMRYKPWPNDACFMDDGTYYGFAAPPQSDYSSVKLYVTKKGKVNSDIRMRNGEGCFGFLLWGRGGRKEYERDLARLRRDWERLAGECPKLEHGTKPIDSFRKGAVSDAIKRSLAEEGAARLDRFESAFDKVEAAMGVYPKGSLQHERTRTRLEMARRLVGEVRRQLKSPGEDGFGFAGLGMADLEEFEKSFGEELANWRRNPDNPEAKAQIFRAADFGVKADGATDDAPALARALAAIKALGGKPSILELGAGTILVCEKTVERKKLVGRHSLGPVEVPTTKLEGQILVSEIDNLLIRGEGADRTRIVFGNYNATGLNLLNCLNTTVRGVELDWREAPFAEGVVVKCDRARKVVELKENPLALKVTDPRFLKGSRRLVCGWFDPEGKVMERPFLFTRGKARRLAGGTVELELDGEKMPEIAAGSTIAVPDRAPYLTAACVYSSFCTFDGVRIRSARSSAFSSTRTHNEAVWRCTIRPRDGLKLSTNADGFYCSRGSFIGNCDFSGMNDDGVNPHGNAAKVKSRIGERTLVHLRSGTTRPGDLYQFVRSPSGQTLQLNRLVSAEPVVIGGRAYVRSTFAEPLPEDLRTEEGEHFADLVFVPQADGSGFVALSNSFSRIRNNAMVVQCPNALVEGNRAEGVLKGLHLCALIYGGWCEGSAPYNAVVRDNVFQDVRIGISTGVLMHKGPPAECAPLEGVEMTGNTVRRAAETAAEFRNLSHAAIVGNQFCRAPQPVAFNRCRDIYIDPLPERKVEK